MSIITFATAGESGSFLTNQCPLTANGRGQVARLRQRLYYMESDGRPTRFEVALVEQTQIGRETAIILVHKQVPAPIWLCLPALDLPPDPDKETAPTEADIVAFYRQFGKGPLRQWVAPNDGKIAVFGAWVHNATAAIQHAVAEWQARHTVVVGQAALLAGIALNMSNDGESCSFLMDSVFAGGEGFRLDSETGAVALITR